MNFIDTDTEYKELNKDQKSLFEQLVEKVSENNNHEMKISFDELDLPAEMDLNDEKSITKFANMASKLISITAKIDQNGHIDTVTCFTQLDINVKKQELDVTADTQFKRFIHRLKKDDQFTMNNLDNYLI